jgi:hypothetical protein
MIAFLGAKLHSPTKASRLFLVTPAYEQRINLSIEEPSLGTPAWHDFDGYDRDG